MFGFLALVARLNVRHRLHFGDLNEPQQRTPSPRLDVERDPGGGETVLGGALDVSVLPTSELSAQERAGEEGARLALGEGVFGRVRPLARKALVVGGEQQHVAARTGPNRLEAVETRVLVVFEADRAVQLGEEVELRPRQGRIGDQFGAFVRVVRRHRLSGGEKPLDGIGHRRPRRRRRFCRLFGGDLPAVVVERLQRLDGGDLHAAHRFGEIAGLERVRHLAPTVRLDDVRRDLAAVVIDGTSANEVGVSGHGFHDLGVTPRGYTSVKNR
ncbi:MAG: hypothetical protein GX458_04525 [Phyllobacteriaceae bacterium]|nr:hypothetical protein [Phyllobacteriaceae bacterium]